MRADLIFDLDGTLMDTLADLTRAVNCALEDVGAPTIPEARARRLIGGGVRRLVERALPSGGGFDVDVTLGRFTEHYAADLYGSTVLYPGVAETLASLEGHRMAVATNKPERFARRLLEHFGLAERFDVVAGGDSAPARKPDPVALAPVFAAWSPVDRGNVWLIGDGDADVGVGQAAGIRTLAVTYGLRDRAELEALEPDAIVDRFTDIPSVVA